MRRRESNAGDEYIPFPEQARQIQNAINIAVNWPKMYTDIAMEGGHEPTGEDDFSGPCPVGYDTWSEYLAAIGALD